MEIYGAGIAGLIAGCMFQTATIFEAGSEGQAQHKAVLRFRTSAVGDAVGIEFRKVRVHKGLWLDGEFVGPSIQVANWYSKKVIGRLADRSIWNLDPVDRFIAPEDFIAQLADRCRGRIVWDHPVTAQQIAFSQIGTPVITTLPMSAMFNLISEADPDLTYMDSLPVPSFSYAPIVVRRWRIPNADVFQTVYFPSTDTSLYRVSITGDLLIAEYVEKEDDYYFWDALGIAPADVESIETTKQRFGKIAKIDELWRKRFIFELSHRYGIFSLGRFGTWRNLLMDDVLKDIGVIKKLINTSSYERSRHAAK